VEPPSPEAATAVLSSHARPACACGLRERWWYPRSPCRNAASPSAVCNRSPATLSRTGAWRCAAAAGHGSNDGRGSSENESALRRSG